jgi:hypothetical protein
MRRYLGIIMTIVLLLAVLAGLNAVSYVSFERQPENEINPLRSSYNPGPTGTRAFYQLLEESGYQVARWREKYASLAGKAPEATLIIVGPAQVGQSLPEEEARELKRWLAGGGRALIVSRLPQDHFPDAAITTKFSPSANPQETDPARLVDERSDVLIAQPTELTRQVRGLAVSRMASRMKFREALPVKVPPPPPPPSLFGEPPAPEGVPESVKAQPPVMNEADDAANEGGLVAGLPAPVVHLGDSDGAVLADFDYGAGRVIFLSDPFVIANHGIARGANLTLALNLVQSLGGRERQLYFEEYYHGYRSESNPLVSYFRSTPVPWMLGQGLLLAALVAYSYGRRFARPLPLPQEDRHSPLEFVGSMANLQQVAQARALALENIYPPFKARLCRALGVSVRARPEEVAAHLTRRRLKVSEAELFRTLSESERALAGGPLDDHRLIALVAAMRRISAQLK